MNDEELMRDFEDVKKDLDRALRHFTVAIYAFGLTAGAAVGYVAWLIWTRLH